ncbi:Protein of unknown function [Lactobacillus delbrueckii subsp. lactis]|nr:Protein of unknown function [Lactobacillus delbrueckii subsp. lactis]
MNYKIGLSCQGNRTDDRAGAKNCESKEIW